MQMERTAVACDLNNFVEVYQSILNNKDDIDQDESKDLMEAFGVFDENKDGYITSEELQHVLSTMGLIPLSNSASKLYGDLIWTAMECWTSLNSKV
ncbi:hypothetical protein SUGI_0209760 [Cryptomeria japonica]|nr:hypothetical protein SUGI_0209760 [Cryptomeria japonica]